jgi:ATP-dependent Clp protease ATP-binding subunit ClpX
MEGINLEFTDCALEEIAAQALKYKTGARALRSITENFMIDIMFDLPNQRGIDKCIIDRRTVQGKKEPLFTKKSTRKAQ